MQELSILNEKLDLLLKAYRHLQMENSTLKKTLISQKDDRQNLESKIDTLEKQLATIRLGGQLTDVEAKDILKQKIDTVIGQIDVLISNMKHA